MERESSRPLRASSTNSVPEPLYRFYRCYRAALRARLTIAHLLEPNPRAPEKWPVVARAYLAIAARETLWLEQWLTKHKDARPVSFP